MTLTLDIEHANSTSTLEILAPDALGDADAPSMRALRIERKVIRQPEGADRAEAVVYRDAWSEIEADLDRTDDRLVIREGGSPIFGGRLADFERSGVVVSVLIDSPKRDAIDAEPSGGNDVYPPQNDSALVTNELLARVPTVDAGTVEAVDADIAFSESHASPGKSIAKLARDADAETRYRTTDTAFELDYVARLGSDRTAETLSPSSATVLGEPRVREKVTEDVTHVRVLGAGEGTAQVEATAVAPSYDAADDRAVYRSRTDKDIQEQSRAQALAETLVAEYGGAREYVEVEFEVPRSVDPALGDEFTVSLPAHNIDTTLRVTTAERLVDGGGDRYRVVLSNRRHTADLDGAQSAVELNSLSEGNPGQYYALSDGEGWDAVDDGTPYQFGFYRPPNTIGELRATLRVESRPYRLRASPTQHSHSVDLTSTTAAPPASFQPSFTVEDLSTVTKDVPEGQTKTFFTKTITERTQPLYISAAVIIANEPQNNRPQGAEITVDWRNKRTGAVGTIIADLPIGSILAPKGVNDVGVAGSRWDVQAGDEIEVRITTTQAIDDRPPTFLLQGTLSGPEPHTHDVTETTTTATTPGVEPGIVEQSGETVSNVDVTAAGQTVATGLDHPIDESIDLSGVLADGRNDIQITSDSLGELRARVEYEALKNADSR